MRLNLGGRNTTIPGFKVVDLYDGPAVDIKADISKLDMIGDRTVNEIYASHCLEHFPHSKTLDVLREWRRVLRPGGKCYIAVPDFDALVKLYLQFGLNQLLVDLGWGGQEYEKAYHYSPFTFSWLANLVNQAGFVDVKRIIDMPYGLKDCSSLVDTYTHKPTSLNVVAIA